MEDLYKVPVGEEELDIEVIVPSECDDTSSTTDPDQPFYSHYGNSKDDGRQQLHKELTLSPHSYGRHMSRRKQHKKQPHKLSSPVSDEQDDLGFVDLEDSDRDDSVLQIEVPDFSARSSSTFGTYHGEVRSPRRAFSRSGRPISARPLLRQDTDSPDSNGDPKQTRRIFHRPSVFVPARYPVKFHKDAAKLSAHSKKARHAALKLPPSLNVKSRYGNQAIVISSKGKRSALKQWPTPPIYLPKPKVRDSSVECHILRLVETLDIGTQHVPIMKTKQCQFGNARKDTGTQYPRVRRKEIGLDPKENPTRAMGIQSVPKTSNAMVETTVSVMYHPNIVITEDRGTQATVTYNKDYGWSHYGTDGSTQKEEEGDWQSTDQVDFEKADPNFLGVPEPDYEKVLENNLNEVDDIDKAYDDLEQNYGNDSFNSVPSEFSDTNSTTLNFGDLTERSVQPVLETHRELVGLPDSGSEDEEEDEDGDDEESGERRDVLEGTTEVDRHLPPLSVCGRSTTSMTSVQIPVEDD